MNQVRISYLPSLIERKLRNEHNFLDFPATAASLIDGDVLSEIQEITILNALVEAGYDFDVFVGKLDPPLLGDPKNISHLRRWLKVRGYVPGGIPTVLVERARRYFRSMSPADAITRLANTINPLTNQKVGSSLAYVAMKHVSAYTRMVKGLSKVVRRSSDAERRVADILSTADSVLKYNPSARGRGSPAVDIESSRGNIDVKSSIFKPSGRNLVLSYNLSQPPDTIYVLVRCAREGRKREQLLFSNRLFTLLTPSEAQRLLTEGGSKKRLGDKNVTLPVTVSKGGSMARSNIIDRVQWLNEAELVERFLELPLRDI